MFALKDKNRSSCGMTGLWGGSGCRIETETKMEDEVDGEEKQRIEE